MPKKAPANEKDVKKLVKAFFDAHDWFWWMPPANMYGRSGISDFHAVKAGVFMVVETKFGKNPPTAMQIAFLNSVRSQESFAFVVNELNVDYLKAFLEAFDRATTAQLLKQAVAPEDGAMMLNAIKELTDF